jgi:UDP-N-acetylglucosamine acyltransferase
MEGRLKTLIHATAILDPNAQIDNNVEIGAYAVVDGPVRIHGGACLRPKAMVTGWTEIGARCVIHSDACIGDAPQDRAYSGARSFCRIGADTIIREGVTVHRGTAPESETVVGQRCLLMVNAHIGHNCHVSDDVVIANGTVLGGHVNVGAGAFLSGNAAIHQFVRIGELTMIGGLAKIVMDVPPFFTVGGAGDACTGINIIGLRRAGLNPDVREELRTAYRLLYRSGLLFRRAVDELAKELKTEAGRRLVEFLQVPSRRGILPGRSRRHQPTPHSSTPSQNGEAV